MAIRTGPASMQSNTNCVLCDWIEDRAVPAAKAPFTGDLINLKSEVQGKGGFYGFSGSWGSISFFPFRPPPGPARVTENFTGI